MLYSGIEIIIVAIFLIPFFTVIMRRLNDIGKSRMLLLIIFIPLVGLLILLYFMTIDSEPSTNKYGPSPKYEVNNNNQTENFIAQNDSIYPPNPIPNNTYPQEPYANPVQQDPNQNLIYQQPYQNPVP
jgi:predicted PurR-regulated permease PerM